MSNIKFDKAQLSQDAWALAEKYGLDADHDGDIDDGVDGAPQKLDLLVKKGTLSPTEQKTATALLNAFDNPSLSAPRNEAAASELGQVIGTRAPRELSTKAIEKLSSGALASATLPERIALVTAIVDDLFMPANLGDTLLAILAQTPEHQRALLFQRLHFDAFDSKQSLEQRLLGKLGGDQKARAVALFNQYFYTNTVSLTFDQRYARLDASLKAGVKTAAEADFVASLITDVPASEDKRLVEKLEGRLGAALSGLAASPGAQQKVASYMTARLHLCSDADHAAAAVAALHITRDSDARIMLASLAKGPKGMTAEVLGKAVASGALDSGLGPIREFTLSQAMAAKTPEATAKSIAQIGFYDAIGLGDFIHELTGAKGAAFSNAVLTKLDESGALATYLPFVDYFAPSSLDTLTDIVNDPAARESAFSQDKAVWDAFSTLVPDGAEKTKLGRTYDQSHDVARLASALQAAEAKDMAASKAAAVGKLQGAIAEALHVPSRTIDVKKADTWATAFSPDLWKDLRAAANHAPLSAEQLTAILKRTLSKGAAGKPAWNQQDKVTLLRAICELPFANHKALDLAVKAANVPVEAPSTSTGKDRSDDGATGDAVWTILRFGD
jgi:hypothetical protein